MARFRLLAILGFLAVLPVAGAQQAQAPSQGQEVSPNYVLGPGDGLNVFVFGNQDLSTNVQVRPDGKISIPLVNDMQAVGKTQSQLGRDIEGVLSEFVRTPKVTIIVTSFGLGAFDNQIRVVGAGASQPQSIPYRQGLTILDVMIAVGLSEFAAGDRAKLVRKTDGEDEETRVKLDRLINRGDMKENRALQPGDVLIIPEARF